MARGIDCATVVQNLPVGGGTQRLRLRCPEIAESFRPGQFVGVQVSPPDSQDPLLRRPMSVMRNASQSFAHPGEEIDLMAAIVGRGTRWMAALEAGDRVSLLGPLGNSFTDDELGLHAAARVVCAAGGVGLAPFFALADWFIEAGRPGDLKILLGARTRDALPGLELVSQLGVEIALATDDGSLGHAGLVTELLAQELRGHGGAETMVLACGPDPMMQAVARLAGQNSSPCLVSLENEMACGFGACYGCVVPQVDARGAVRRHARACVEGPIFSTTALGWDR